MTTPSSNTYETDESLDMYLGLHYSSSLDSISAHELAPTISGGDNTLLAFPQRVAQLLVKIMTSSPDISFDCVLDIGCAVGGTAFELAKSFQRVDAFDTSNTFIETACRIQSGENVQFPVRIEGDICEQAIVGDVPYRERVTFFTGDACQLEETVGKSAKYDAVVLANLLCRVPDPDACLNGLAKVVKRGGFVLLVTPFTWLEEYTLRSKWIGGTDGKRSIDVLQERMSNLGFTKIHDEEMPFTIREHHRKYQYIVSKATGWKKK